MWDAIVINAQTNKLFLLQEVNTLFDFLKTESQRNKSLKIQDFLHTMIMAETHRNWPENAKGYS